jgi:hypothetical protein
MSTPALPTSYEAQYLPPARPDYCWAAYVKSIDGHVTIDFAVGNIPNNDYEFEQIPIVQPTPGK